MNNKISIGCAVNSAIISDVIAKNKLGDFYTSCVDVPKKHNIILPVPGTPWPFENDSWLAYQLYCMVVVSKEMYNDDFYIALKEKGVESLFHIDGEKDSSIKCIIRHLRNAISHVSYFISDDGEVITFEDGVSLEGAKKSSGWIAEISRGDMAKFFNVINECVFKLENRIKNGDLDSKT
jgi:hypothetical protein